MLRIGVTLLAVIAAACGAEPGPERLTVGAAASLRDLLESTRSDFRATARVEFSFGASSLLARQIAEGAAFDIYLSADRVTLERVSGLLDESTVRTFLGNRLVMVVCEDLVDAPQDPEALAAGSWSVGVAGPAVPAGRHAREELSRRGLLAGLEGRLVSADDVRKTLAMVESGTVDCAFVYATDAAVARGARQAWAAPAAEVEYIAGILLTSRAPLADAWLDWLGSEGFHRVAREHGFVVPGAGG